MNTIDSNRVARFKRRKHNKTMGGEEKASPPTVFIPQTLYHTF